MWTLAQFTLSSFFVVRENHALGASVVNACQVTHRRSTPAMGRNRGRCISVLSGLKFLAPEGPTGPSLASSLAGQAISPNASACSVFLQQDRTGQDRAAPTSTDG